LTFNKKTNTVKNTNVTHKSTGIEDYLEEDDLKEFEDDEEQDEF